MLFSGPSKEATTGEQATTTTEANVESVATTTAETQSEVIGRSVQEHDITAYHFGSGTDEILLIGDIHGGYEWNTAKLSYSLMSYLNSYAIPTNERVTVIPVMNPDGLTKVADGWMADFTVDSSASPAMLTAGRFNANKVDLSRNFDCQWQATGVWQNTKVSGGSAPFSEPESRAVRDYINAHRPKAVIVYYSAAGGVYASACGNGILPETKALTTLYANASGYKAYDKFDAYPTSGDMVNWLAKQNIPAISVLLTNHTDTEFDKNLAGVKAVLTRYAK